MKRLLNHQQVEIAMKIKRFELKAIEAERYSERDDKKKNIKIDHNSSVTNIRKIEADKNSIEFKFTAGYSSIGMIKIKGSMILIGELPDLAQNWREKKKMPNEIAKRIHSVVIKKCIPQAVTIAKDLNLPPPIPLPKVNLPDEKTNTTSPKGGMEVA